MTMGVRSGLKTTGTYEVRDSTCEKCEVQMTRIESNGKVTFICPTCGGNIGRLKQKGVF